MARNDKHSFWKKVKVGKDDECWEWLACKNKKGYGFFRVNWILRRAHRFAWTVTYGKIPEGLFVCHRCDNPGCCNPKHLFLGTNTDNMVDMISKGRASWQKGVQNE